MVDFYLTFFKVILAVHTDALMKLRDAENLSGGEPRGIAKIFF
jgi:hypothetical protein